MELYVLFLLLITSIIVFLYSRITKQSSNFIFIVLGLLLIITAGFRNGEHMPDYATYQGMYYQVINSNYYFTEVSFVIIAKIANILSSNNPLILFVIYAFLGVLLKMISIKKLSEFFFCSLIIYISNYYILHEMIQIRVGVASAFVLLSIQPLYKHNFKQFVLLILIATTFHFSALICFFLWFLKTKSYNKLLFIFIILLAYFLNLINISIIDSFVNIVPSSIIKSKLLTYFDVGRRASFDINVFSPFILTRIVIMLFFTYYVNQISCFNNYFIILLKMYSIGLFMYIGFSSYPEIAVRTSQLFMTTEIVIIPCVLYVVKGNIIPRLIIIIYALLMFVLNTLFTTYFSY